MWNMLPLIGDNFSFVNYVHDVDLTVNCQFVQINKRWSLPKLIHRFGYNLHSSPIYAHLDLLYFHLTFPMLNFSPFWKRVKVRIVRYFFIYFKCKKVRSNKWLMILRQIIFQLYFAFKNIELVNLQKLTYCMPLIMAVHKSTTKTNHESKHRVHDWFANLTNLIWEPNSLIRPECGIRTNKGKWNAKIVEIFFSFFFF